LLNAGDNAQAYFKEYHRLKRAVEAVQEPIRKAREELEFLDDLLYFTESAVEAQELEDIRRQWNELKISENPQLKGKATRSVQTGPQGPKAFLYKDFKILVGRNPRQNDQLTFKIAALGDIWLHAHNSPGAHVVIKAAGRRIPAEVLEAAAILAARSCKVKRHGSM
jgi:predicted ribosome quality control (RQC) complex YloA/Tae2 family protein